MVRARPPEAQSRRDWYHPRAPRHLRAQGKRGAARRDRQDTGVADGGRHAARADQAVARQRRDSPGLSQCPFTVVRRTFIQCVLDSALALIPIDSAAFAYQLADFKIIARRAGRFLDLTFFSFCLSSFEAMPPAGA